MMGVSMAPVLGMQSADHDHCLHLPEAYAHWLCSHSGMTHLLPHTFLPWSLCYQGFTRKHYEKLCKESQVQGDCSYLGKKN